MNNLNTKELYSMALKLAIPIMIQNLINTLVNTADTIMLGQIISVVIVCLYFKKQKKENRYFYPSSRSMLKAKDKPLSSA